MSSEQYWSYCVGIANGGSAVFLPQDDNTFKDIYFRVARKWFGYPLDGVIGTPEQAAGAAKSGGNGRCRLQHAGIGLLARWAWRQASTVGSARPTSLTLPQPASSSNDYFQRIGMDGRLQYFDLDIYGTIFLGHDPFPGFLQDKITPAGPTEPIRILYPSRLYVQTVGHGLCAL